MQTTLIVILVEGVVHTEHRAAVGRCVLLAEIVAKILPSGRNDSFSRRSLSCRHASIPDHIISIAKQESTIFTKDFLPEVQMVCPVRIHVPRTENQSKVEVVVIVDTRYPTKLVAFCPVADHIDDGTASIFFGRSSDAE